MSERGADYHVDIQGLEGHTGSLGGSVPATPGTYGPPGRGQETRPWLAIHWRCCDVYSRIYRKPSDTSYIGRCPKCQKKIDIPIGPGGTHARIFEAY